MSIIKELEDGSLAFTVEGEEMTWEIRMLAYLVKLNGEVVEVSKKELLKFEGLTMTETESTIKIP